MKENLPERLGRSIFWSATKDLPGETDVQAIKELYEELNAFYGYEQETKMASLICAEWLQTSLAKQRVGPATEVNVGGKR